MLAGNSTDPADYNKFIKVARIPDQLNRPELSYLPGYHF